ncbi:MAG: AbrB/MazE/SpoVT family DNA-binding domain-containing protein [Myxococcota bacterium]
MAIQRKVKKVGGSLGVLIPRDIAEAMSVEEGSPVRLTLVGRQLVVEPADDYATDAEFQRAFATVLRRYGPTFEALAEYDRGNKRR